MLGGFCLQNMKVLEPVAESCQAPHQVSVDCFTTPFHVKIDSDAVTVVDFRRSRYKNDLFIMVSQAVQIFYTIDPDNLELS